MAAAERICGVVGAGLMGSAVCARLRGAGFDVSVFDVDAAKAAALTSIAGSVSEEPPI